MSRLILLFAALSLAISPGFCSSSAHASPKHAALRTCRAPQKNVRLPQATAPSTHDEAIATVLNGRLIYDELEVPADLEAGEQQIQHDEQSIISETDRCVPEAADMQDHSELKIVEPKNMTLREAGHLAVADWITFLKLLAMKFATAPLDATDRPKASEVNDSQSQKLAEDIASYIATQATPQDTTVLLVSQHQTSSDVPLTLALGDSLRRQGFGVLDSKRQGTDAQVLRYEIIRVDDGVMVELQFQQKQINQYYRLDASSNLIGCAPRSVREAR